MKRHMSCCLSSALMFTFRWPRRKECVGVASSPLPDTGWSPDASWSRGGQGAKNDGPGGLGKSWQQSGLSSSSVDRVFVSLC